jgi:Fic family protein
MVGESVRAFVPNPLPPEPAIDMRRLYQHLDRANQALGRLDGLTKILPDTSFFLFLYTQKEALLSAQIEGTQSSLSDLLVFENSGEPNVPLEDVREVSNYVDAMEYGLRRVKKDGFPISLRLIKEIHARLLHSGRGAEKTPGEFRRSQNWIGGTRPGNALFVPPPPDRLMECMGSFELFLHDDTHQLPLLIELGLVHVQFETIHPFLDGNGRLGRLLITLMLCARNVLSEPMLYLSLYFKSNRDRYYDLLQRVRTEGAWEEWLIFFLEGTETTARSAAETAKQILDLFARDRERIHQGLKRAAPNAFRVHEYLQKNPVANIAGIASKLDLAAPTVTSALLKLRKLGITKEMTGRRRGRFFAYSRYLKILSEGTDPLKLA